MTVRRQNPDEQERWVLVLAGQPVDPSRVGVLFESEESAAETAKEIGHLSGAHYEVRRVRVRPGRWVVRRGGYGPCLVVLGEAT